LAKSSQISIKIPSPKVEWIYPPNATKSVVRGLIGSFNLSPSDRDMDLGVKYGELFIGSV
jgi:hypothetical protein